jgi:PAS domain S-box-containing protein
LERNIEILSHDEWYFKEGVLDLSRVITGWNEKLNDALAKGYEGMRVSGNTGWIQKEGWRDFREYEKELAEQLEDKRMIVLCDYPLANHAAAEVLNVARNHQFAIARRHGNWDVLEAPELMQAKREIKRLNEELEQRVIERTRELALANEELRREIGERKRMEEKFKQSESQLAEAQHLAHVGSWSLDLRSNTVTWSDELYRIFGVQPSEFDHSYEAVVGTTHPEDRDWLRSLIENSLKTHEPFSAHYRITLPTGELRVLHAQEAVVTDEHGNAGRMHGAAQDVTERKLAEEALTGCLSYEELVSNVETEPALAARVLREANIVTATPTASLSIACPYWRAIVCMKFWHKIMRTFSKTKGCGSIRYVVRRQRV